MIRSRYGFATFLLALALSVLVAAVPAFAADPSLPLSGAPPTTGAGDIGIPGCAEAAGTALDVVGSDYLDVSLRSSRPLRMRLESYPRMITIALLEPEEGGPAEMVLSGLEPSRGYWLYAGRDGPTALVAGSDGAATFSLDVSTAVTLCVREEPSTIHLTAAGWSDPSVGTWDAVSRVARLTADITQTIQVDVDDVTVDGAGHEAVGRNTIDGVYCYGRRNVQIRDLRVRGFYRGVAIGYSTGCTVSYVDATANSHAGIDIWTSSSASVLGCAISRNNQNGLQLEDMSGPCVVRDNLIEENATCDLEFGESIDRSWHNVITGNVGSGGLPIVYLEGTGASLEDTSVSELVLAQADGAVVRRVLVAGSATARNDGVLLCCSDDVVMEDVVSSGNSWGVRASKSRRATVRRLTANGGRTGVLLQMGTSASTFEDVTASGNTTGVNLAGSAGDTFTRLHSTGGSYGVWTTSSTGDAFVDCLISGNAYGLLLEGFSAGRIQDNTIAANTLWDVCPQSADPLQLNVVTGNIGSGALPIVYASGIANLHDVGPVSELVLVSADLSTVDGVVVREASSLRNNGVYVYSTRNAAIRGVDASGTRYGVYLDKSDGNVVSGAVCESAGMYGVVLSASNANTVTACSVSDSGGGVAVQMGSSRNAIADNDFAGNGTGLTGSGGSLNTFSGNTLVDHTWPLYCQDTSDTIAGNTVIGDGWSRLEGAVGTAVRDNDISDCSQAFEIKRSRGTLVTGNVIHDNLVGIGIQESTGTLVYANTFLRNSYRHASVASVSDCRFNLPRPVGGNYWDTWCTPDADTDGFVDLPYVVGTGGVDELPLSRQPGADDAPPTSVATVDPAAPDGAAGWYVHAPEVTITATDGVSGSGVASTSYRIGCGDWLACSGPFRVTAEGTVTLSFRSTDAAGNVEDTRTLTLLVDTLAPTLTLDPEAVTADEGLMAEAVVRCADTLGEVSLSVSRGTLEPSGSGAWRWKLPVSDGPADGGDVVFTASDGHGNSGRTTLSLTARNIAPEVAIDDRVADPLLAGSTLTLGAAITDPGLQDTHTASWSWGDGTTSAGTVDAARRVGGSHAYASAGVYHVALVVTDSDGAAGTDAYDYYVVVFDPTAGFVTGGGWILSPPGAYPAAPALTGKATFGFVSRYLKGASVPSGQTEFQFKAGDLDFHSDAYQWLVVAGGKAIYKGTGTIDGAGGYGFMISAVDGDLVSRSDTFRIKIWDATTGLIVYDNQIGADETADPVTTLGGGSIVIHK